MKIYNYDSDSGEYTGESLAEKSPLECEVWLIPAFATHLAPPACEQHQVPVWDSKKWHIKADYRDTVYYMRNADDQVEAVTIKTIGDTVPEKGYLHFDDMPKPQPGIDEIRSQLSNAVQNMLDNKVRERNYDNIISACSYIASANPQFADEAMTCVLWRDAVWAECYDLLDKVTSGEMKIPTEEALLAMLPQLEWPS